MGTLLGITVYALVDRRPSVEEQVALARDYLDDGNWRSAALTLRNVVQGSPSHAVSRVLLARALLGLGNGARAAKEIEHAKALGVVEGTLELELEAKFVQGLYSQVVGQLATLDGVGDSVPLAMLRGEASLALRRLDGAAEAFNAVLALEPGHSRASRGNARIAALRGEFAQAEKILGDILRATPNDPEVWVLLGEVALARGDGLAARTAFREAIRANPTAAQAQVGLARAHLADGEPASAQALLEALRKAHPCDPLVNYWYGMTARAGGEVDRAKAAFLAVLSRLPEHRESLFALSAIYYEQRELHEAEAILRRLDRLARGHIPTKKLLAATQLALGQAPTAIATLSPAHVQRPNDVQLLVLLGNAHLRAGSPDLAAKLFEKAASLVPEASALRTRIAFGELAMGRPTAATRSVETAVELDPNLVEGQALLIALHLNPGRYPEALSAALALVEAHPDDPVAHNFLAGSYQFTGSHDQARAHYARAIELQASYASAYLNLARLEEANGRHDHAAAQYEALLVVMPHQLDALLGRAQLALDAGRSADAFAFLETARVHHPKASAPRQILATMYLREGRSKQALAESLAANELAPESSAALLTLGQAQLANGNATAARAAIDQAVTLRPSAPGYYLLGDAQRAAGHAKGAQRSFERALSLQPQHLGARVGLGKLALGRGAHEEALRRARELQQTHPAHPAGQLLESAIWRAAKVPQRALAGLDSAHQITPSSGLVLAIAELLEQLGNPHAARNRLDEWLEVHPTDNTVRERIAEAAFRSGNRGDAIARYEEIVTVNEDHVPALNNLAWLLLNEDRTRALAFAERAAQLAPDDLIVLDTYGWVLLHSGQEERAVQILNRVVEFDPDPSHRFHLGVALLRVGEVTRARQLIELALAAKQGFPERVEAEGLLARL